MEMWLPSLSSPEGGLIRLDPKNLRLKIKQSGYLMIQLVKMQFFSKGGMGFFLSKKVSFRALKKWNA